jgi:hypothetical protein
VSAPHPVKTTIVAGDGKDGILAAAQPRVGDVLADRPQPGQDVTQVLPQPEAIPVAARPSDVVQNTPTVPARAARQSRLRQAARALLEAWEEAASADALDEHFAALRAALVMEASASLSTDHPRPLRDTKQARVLAMLSRPEGASGR